MINVFVDKIACDDFLITGYTNIDLITGFRVSNSIAKTSLRQFIFVLSYKQGNNLTMESKPKK